MSKQQDTVCVIGLGYVGLPLALRCAEAGLHVIGIDTDPDKVDTIGNGRSYFRHIPSDRVQDAVARRLRVTTDHAAVAKANAVLICVPTPLDAHRVPDLGAVRATVQALLPHVRKGQLIALESTSYPGTTEEHLAAPLSAAGWRVGQDIHVVYAPEREDPGNPRYHTSNTPKVIGGISPACCEAGIAFYGRLVEQVVPVRDARTAELTKLLENIYRAVNIGLVNEMKMVAEAMDIDIHEVIDAAATKPFGFTPFRPGPGLGGHCIPIDPFYLSWKARELGVDTRFIELAGQVNHAMPGWVVRRVAAALNDMGRSIRGSRILILGVAYKKNVEDLRETPAAPVITSLQAQGAEVHYADPWVQDLKPMRHYALQLSRIELLAEGDGDQLQQQLSVFDCAVLITDHDAFDYDALLRHSRCIVDTRGRFPRHEKVHPA